MVEALVEICMGGAQQLELIQNGFQDSIHNSRSVLGFLPQAAFLE